MMKHFHTTGFTLAELLIATFIVTLTAAGTFVLLGSGAQFGTRRSHRYEAYELGSQTLDTLKDYVSYDDADTVLKYRLTEDNNVGVNCAAGASTRYALKQLLGGQRHCHPLPTTSLVGLGVIPQRQRTYQVTDVDLNGDGRTDYKRVTVTVNWTEKQ